MPNDFPTWQDRKPDDVDQATWDILCEARDLRDQLHKHFDFGNDVQITAMRKVLKLKHPNAIETMAIMPEDVHDNLISTLRMLLGPHGKTIYKALLAKLEKSY